MAQTDTAWLASGSDVIEIGTLKVMLRDLGRIRLVEESERDIAGQLLNFALYTLAAALVLVAVIEFSWTTRFLIASAFFAVVGLMALADVVTMKPIVYYRILFELRDGRLLSVAFNTLAEAEGHYQRLHQRLAC